MFGWGGEHLPKDLRIQPTVVLPWISKLAVSGSLTQTIHGAGIFTKTFLWPEKGSM